MTRVPRWLTDRFVVAVAITSIALLFRLVLRPWLGQDMPLLFFVPAVLVSGWYGGLVPGLLTTALSTTAAWIFLLTPQFASVAGDTTDLRALALFVVVGIAVSWFTGSLHRSAERERTAAAQAADNANRLAIARERTSGLLSNVPGVVWEAHGRPGSTALKVDFVSDYIETMLGYPPSRWTDDANFWLAIVHPDDKACAAREAQEIYAGGRGASSQFRVIAKDGRTVWVESRSQVIKDGQGRPIGLRGVTMDITSQKEIEQQRDALLAEARELNRVKDQFLATLSHELRTPINAVLGWTQMLRTGVVGGDRATAALETIERNAFAQQRLIEDLLDVSRIITGKFRLERQLLNVGTVVQEAVHGVEPAAQAKGVVITVKVGDGVPAVFGDAHRLQQAIWNLLSNAVKFTNRGGSIDVNVSAAGNSVEITVRDSGIGIAPDVLPYIFERFTQADSSTTRLHAGIGLGLAIVRHIVELHGGTATAVSGGLGHGATFCLQLPADLRAAASSESVEGTLPKLTGIRVLLVEDDKDAREMIELLLREHGADVHSAESAPEAMKAFDTRPFDIILSDLEMPGEDGYTFMQRIRARQAAAAKHTPAVAVTAYGSAEDQARASAAGFDRHLVKPIDIADIVSTVAALGRSSGQASLPR
jgi:PAS domain S-box-containing protein